MSIAGKEYKDIIGDGVVVATPFGSTGYYKSTGGRPFESGIGVSFNNLHNKAKYMQSLVIPEKSIIRITIQRGPGWVISDNDDKFIEVTERGMFARLRKRKAKHYFSKSYNELKQYCEMKRAKKIGSNNMELGLKASTHRNNNNKREQRSAQPVTCAVCNKQHIDSPYSLTIEGQTMNFCTENCFRNHPRVKQLTHHQVTSIVLNKTSFELLAILTGLVGLNFTLQNMEFQALVLDTLSVVTGLAAFIIGIEHLRY